MTDKTEIEKKITELVSRQADLKAAIRRAAMGGDFELHDALNRERQAVDEEIGRLFKQLGEEDGSD